MSEANSIPAACSPTWICPACDGSGTMRKPGAWSTIIDCDSCEGLGAIFKEVVLRGHWAFEGQTVLIEGYPPVMLAREYNGRRAFFVAATEPEPPYWFVKEDGKQVYIFQEGYDL